MSILQKEFAEDILPYLEKHNIYRLFREIATELVISTPADHVKHIKTYLINMQKGLVGQHRIILLVADGIKIDKKELARRISLELNTYVLVRVQVFENYFKDVEPKICYSPAKLAIVTKDMITGDHTEICGWLMFDTPCSLIEARCLQREGVLPTITLMLVAEDSLEYERTSVSSDDTTSSHKQDIPALAWAYKDTLRKVTVTRHDSVSKITEVCVAACHNCGVVAFGPLRLSLLGPKGSGRNTQAQELSKHFNLIHVNFKYLYEQAKLAMTEEGERLRKHGPNVEDLAAILNRRLLEKDCVCNGWVLTNYPNSEDDFERLLKLKTPPNRIIFLDVDCDLCEKRLIKENRDLEKTGISEELARYFSVLPRLCEAAGSEAVHVSASVSSDKVLVALQSALLTPIKTNWM